MEKILVCRLSPMVKLPTREPESVGYDVYAYGDHIINPGETKIIPLGWNAVLEPGYAAFIWDRSSFGAKGLHVFKQYVDNPDLLAETHNVVPFGGVIDWSYRGQWGVILHNFLDRIYTIKHHDKITQFVVQKVEEPEIEEISQEEFEKHVTLRGAKGYGCSDGQNTEASAQQAISGAATAATAVQSKG